MRNLIFFAACLAIAPAFAVDVGKPMPPAAAVSGYRGKVLYVDFWASWCVPCRTSMPALEALYKKYGERGFVVVGVNKDDRITDAQRFLQRYPATFPQATDADDKVVRAFGVAAMPSGYLVDRKGTVRAVHQGFTAETAASLEADIEKLLKEAP